MREALEEQGYSVEQYSFPTVKPIDKEVITECAAKFEHIFTVEEHNIIGGFGSAVSEILAELGGTRAKLLKIGLDDKYSSIVGSQKYLRDIYGMSARKIVERVSQEII